MGNTSLFSDSFFHWSQWAHIEKGEHYFESSKDFLKLWLCMTLAQVIKTHCWCDSLLKLHFQPDWKFAESMGEDSAEQNIHQRKSSNYKQEKEAPDLSFSSGLAGIWAPMESATSFPSGYWWQKLMQAHAEAGPCYYSNKFAEIQTFVTGCQIPEPNWIKF